MSFKRKHTGKINKGDFIPFNNGAWSQELQRYEGQTVIVTVGKIAHDRSGQQNKYYWAVIVDILAEYFGYTKDEMHDVLKWHFLKYRSITIAGRSP